MTKLILVDLTMQSQYIVLFNPPLCPVGWEYAVEAGIGSWVPYERNIHLSRRRRWVRTRVRDKDSKAIEKKRVSVHNSNGHLMIYCTCML